MQKFDVIIVGSGLGGLLCANLLSKEGYSVCVVDKNNRIGGMIQSFARNGVVFNTGLNYTESLSEGEVLYKYFKYFDIIDKVKFKRLGIDCFEKISFQNDPLEYDFAQGYNNFVETLAEKFPKEKQNLKNYINKIGKVCDGFPFYNLDSKISEFTTNNEFLEVSVDGFLSSVTSDVKLQKVLAGTNILYAGVKDKTPLYIHALINYSFIKSAWRIVDGGSKLAIALANGAISNGAVIAKRKEVVNFEIVDKKVKAVHCKDGEILEAKYFISNIHPSRTLSLINKNEIKKAYLNRISSLENTVGMFSLYIVLKKNSYKYRDFNYHHFVNDNVWTTKYKKWPENFLLYTQANSKDKEFASGITVITYMNYEDVKKWENSYTGSRGEEYENFKRERAEKLLDCIENRIPDIRTIMQGYYTSTPLTYRDYTGTINGSAYGVLKAYNYPLKSLIVPKSRIPNLYFTGQNLNMHGILGVTIGAVSTCSEFLGQDYLLDRIRRV